MNEESAHALFDALARLDFNTYASLLAEDAVEGRPQLRERFVGRDNIVGMYRSVPGEPKIEWRKVRGEGGTWVAEGTIEYGQDMGTDYVVAVVEMRDGRMVDGNLYFASPLEPIAYHQPWSEPSEL